MNWPTVVGIVLGVLAFAGFVAATLANVLLRYFDEGND